MLSLTLFALGAVAVWIVPVEDVCTWAVDRAENSSQAEFIAFGRAEAAWWLARLFLPVFALLAAWATLQLPVLEDAIERVQKQFLRQTRCSNVVRTVLVRGLIVCWLLLALAQTADAVVNFTREWGYFRFNPGSEILPNMSLENREVLAYLKSATPENARILVLSDQKLFFLSYYLQPRRLIHPTHESAEFAIPQAGQPHQYQAYQLSDLSPEWLARVRPDYILEYFEGSEYNLPQRRSEDASWIANWEQKNQTKEPPPYVLVLRRIGEALP
ncbi:hypothetical protein SAMN05421753_104321 [Planctomicrobium piriforme]|uniref:Uncharacterized protein n=2 Tax=Planctomicrobium piriforme TaxID=1576369 RepID=A0A1I3EQJ9_9PLAN|nr:hypothetical protein SAMN05421753_104321 [Planctomicrobium piriforme]